MENSLYFFILGYFAFKKSFEMYKADNVSPALRGSFIWVSLGGGMLFQLGFRI